MHISRYIEYIMESIDINEFDQFNYLDINEYTKLLRNREYNNFDKREKHIILNYFPHLFSDTIETDCIFIKYYNALNVEIINISDEYYLVHMKCDRYVVRLKLDQIDDLMQFCKLLSWFIQNDIEKLSHYIKTRRLS